ncbi:MAG TPA: GGDEF domain-containing protein [Candidatus Acidoferrum sp.]|nr:GGDEF domain-containing protein [Candidatus Acidoferrum sp.]
MNTFLQKFANSLSPQSDPVLSNAGLSGERFVAKIRLILTGGLLIIPLVNTVFFEMNRAEAVVGLSLTITSFLLSIAAYILAAKGRATDWLSFASSFFDVSLVSAALAAFLFLGEPHTAVNSKVIFEGYFLAIAGTSLRYDRRVCLSAGILALLEYAAIVFFTARHWDLNSEAYAPYPYGMFSWSAQISRLILMATASALTIAIVSRSQKLLRLATLDPLTALYNRGYVDERFAAELSRAQRHNQSLAVAVIDVDRFKTFNDTYGHAAGDVALRSLGSVLRQSFRQSDTVGRYGGEEFVILLPETNLDAAHQKLETLRKAIAVAPISLPSGTSTPGITISVGLAVFPTDGADTAELFASADERLFQAKREGRNRVVSGDAVLAC